MSPMSPRSLKRTKFGAGILYSRINLRLLLRYSSDVPHFVTLCSNLPIPIVFQKKFAAKDQQNMQVTMNVAILQLFLNEE